MIHSQLSQSMAIYGRSPATFAAKAWFYGAAIQLCVGFACALIN
jgi:hypothetical protein